MSHEVYSPDRYPKCCTGYVTLMDETAVQTIIEMIFQYDLDWIKSFPLDDVLFTGIFVNKNGRLSSKVDPVN